MDLLLKTVEKLGSFVYAQGVDVGTQYIQYLTISLWLAIGVAAALLLLGSGTAIYAVLKRKLVLGVVAGLVVIGSGAVIGTKVDDAIKITVAPKVYMIEKGYNLVKQVKADFKPSATLEAKHNETSDGNGGLFVLSLIIALPILLCLGTLWEMDKKKGKTYYEDDMF